MTNEPGNWGIRGKRKSMVATDQDIAMVGILTHAAANHKQNSSAYS